MSKNKKKKIKQKIKKQLQKHQKELEGGETIPDEGKDCKEDLTTAPVQENGCNDTEEISEEKMDINSSQNDKSDEQMDDGNVVKTVPENTQNELSFNTREQPVAPAAPTEESDSNGADVRMLSVERDFLVLDEVNESSNSNDDRSREGERKIRPNGDACSNEHVEENGKL